ncbi:MAG: dNTP triphosphohydrolase, partial [Planctomycetes bacterium]|nr:dNTP triphosphohydrolase [Planctomycetota bacterium]
DHSLRTCFQRDRDRIVHSQSFRRMEYKTQVFVTGNCDHFRTRLTHTIEVAGITRTIVRALGLNEDLAETIALGHDIGHPPFGHCGEHALNRLLVDHGGFDHNRQALRVVDHLEEKYPGHPGLNLTWETRTGLMKHRETDCVLDGESLPPQPHLEAQAADIADELTYVSHDLD